MPSMMLDCITISTMRANYLQYVSSTIPLENSYTMDYRLTTLKMVVWDLNANTSAPFNNITPIGIIQRELHQRGHILDLGDDNLF